MKQSSATELASWNVEAQPFLKSILDGVAQPVWVVDHEGFIRFANPAAWPRSATTGCPSSRASPATRRSTTNTPTLDFPVEKCPMLLPRKTGQTIHSDEDWFFRRDGTRFPVSYWSAPIETPQGRGAVVAFTDIEDQRKAERAVRERDLAEARAGEARAAQRRTIEAADAARRQVARDLHDGAQQQFVNVVINLQRAQQKWTPEPERAQGATRYGYPAGEGRHRRTARACRGHPSLAPDHARTARRGRGTGGPDPDRRRAAGAFRSSASRRRSRPASTSWSPRH